MKSISWLTPGRLSRAGILVTYLSMVMFWTSCSEEQGVSPQSQNAPGQLKKLGDESEIASSSNSETDADCYTITATKDGAVWTYEICLKPCAKGVSHFILDLANCPWSNSLTINSILWATVNGEPAILDSSEGNTGCDVSSVTNNFVKFDDLPDADKYEIKFELNSEYGNVLETTAWIKAGNSCNSYVVNGPCCPI
ncbi:MAG TPA: hypothetical protein VIH22_03385 [Cyclobacteriaceae bacterium]